MLQESRERFNQHQIEVVFTPGERVRLWKYATVRHGTNDDEIASKLKLDNAEYEVVRRIGESTTRYKLRNIKNGKEVDAHVSQFARMRVQQVLQDGVEPNATTPPVLDSTMEKLWDKLRPATFVVLNRTDETKQVLRVLEVLSVDDDSFHGWYYVHGGASAKGKYDTEKPLAQQRFIPEWCHNSTGKVVHNPSAAVKKNCRRITDEFAKEDCELISTGWSLESGGKIPPPVVAKADTWLRAQRTVEPRVVMALSNPSEAELKQRRKFA